MQTIMPGNYNTYIHRDSIFAIYYNPLNLPTGIFEFENSSHMKTKISNH